MRIISLHKYYEDRDGASRYQLEVNRLLEARGHDVIPFAMKSSTNLLTSWAKYFALPMETNNVRFRLRDLRAFGRMLYGWEARDHLRRLIADAKPDVAHVHNIYTQLSPSVLDALHEAGIPAVMTVHDYHLVSPNYMRWSHGRVEDLSRMGIVRATLSRFHKHSYAASFAQTLAFKLHHWLRLYERNVSLFLCPSAFVKERMELAGFSPDKLRVLPHFVETAGVTPSFSGNGSVLFVGRFVEEKGVRFLLDLAEKMPETPFVLAGDGPLGDEVRARTRSLSHVTWAGWADRSALHRLYAESSIVVVPSLWEEVFGLVALEAMAHGKPVVVSDRGGLPEVVENEKTGLVLPAGDLFMWKSALESLLSDPARAADMGRAGRERAEKVYSPEKHVEALVQAFEEAMRR